VQAESTAPAITFSQRDSGNGTRNILEQTIVPESATATAKSELPKVAPFRAQGALEKPVLNPQHVEKHVDVNTFVFERSQALPNDPISSFSTGHETETVDDQLGMSAQRVISGNPAQEFADVPTVDMKETETREEYLRRSFVANKETQGSLQPEALTKADPGQQDLRADQTHLTDEKIHAVEKEYELSDLLESASAATNAPKEFASVGSLEKGRTIPVNLHTIEVIQQAVRQLNGRLQSGVASMHVQLNPDVLGAVEVEMVRDAQGVSVTFFAEQASTGKLLETQLSQLRQSLVDSGVQLAGLNIGQHSHTGQEGGFQHQNMNFAQTPQRETFHREGHTQERPRAERMTGQTSEVDYLI
jgi:hypothetical protein